MQRPSEPRAAHILVLGQRLAIGHGRDVVHWSASRLEDQDASGELVTVAWPTDPERKLLPVKAGDTLHLSVSTAQDAMYSAAVTVKAVTREPVPLVILRIVGDWMRTQRRDAVRFAIGVRPRLAACMYSDGARKKLRLVVTNISEGGVRLRSLDEIRPGDRIELAFALPGLEKELQVEARVRRVYHHDRDSQTIWEAGCQFEGLSAGVAQRIVQFIFTHQRAQARAKKV
jgi:c-di-GMP-binding flagellar brake protein YcgR